MRNRIVNIFVVLLSILLMECATWKSGDNVPKTIEGIIVVSGNAPFEYLGLQTAEGEVYKLECSDEIKHMLLVHQGKKAVLQVYFSANDGEGTRVRVMSAQLL